MKLKDEIDKVIHAKKSPRDTQELIAELAALFESAMNELIGENDEIDTDYPAYLDKDMAINAYRNSLRKKLKEML